MCKRNCKNCFFGKPAGYEQVICQKNNTWRPELYSCDWHVIRDCEYRFKIPTLSKNCCGAYGESKRPDGKHWSHYPFCSNRDCPLAHPELLEGAVLKGE